MNVKQKIRLGSWLGVICLIATAIALVLYALKQNINLFYTPTDLLKSQLSEQQVVRVGGYVKAKSLHFDNSGEDVTFTVTDRVKELGVTYHGLLPNLFREGQGVVMTGNFTGKHFIASEVLAKHDEKYMPENVKQLLKKVEADNVS
jgi:cytochrome c-type biogenesis protein CcmE